MNRVLCRTAFLFCFAAGFTGCTSPHEAIRNRIQETLDTEAYGKYRNGLAQSNIELEKAGQAPVPILNREDWVKGETAKKEAAGQN